METEERDRKVKLNQSPVAVYATFIAIEDCYCQGQKDQGYGFRNIRTHLKINAKAKKTATSLRFINGVHYDTLKNNQ